MKECRIPLAGADPADLRERNQAIKVPIYYIILAVRRQRSTVNLPAGQVVGGH